MSGLRLPTRSDHAPETIFSSAAVASAAPSISPSAKALTPSPPTRNTGSSAWTISEDMSMHRLTTPSAQTLRWRAGRGVMAEV